jgi:hypothetical protein
LTTGHGCSVVLLWVVRGCRIVNSRWQARAIQKEQATRDNLRRYIVPYGTLEHNKLVASFHECKHGSPWPSWRPRAVAACGAVSKIRGTPRQRGGWQAHDHCMLCSCTPEMYEPDRYACSSHVSRGYTDQQNSQPVNSQDGHAIPSSQRNSRTV